MTARFYVDGYNFYHALHAAGRPWLKWMCYRRLAEIIARPGEVVQSVTVFSAIADHFPPSAARHRILNAALEARGVEVVLGRFSKKPGTCNSCGHTWLGHEEKESDVQLCLHLLRDAVRGEVDVAYIVSTDADVAPVARMVRAECPAVQLVAVGTPGRPRCGALDHQCHRQQRVSLEMVSRCLLPGIVLRPDGSVAAKRPTAYDPPV